MGQYWTALRRDLWLFLHHLCSRLSEHCLLFWGSYWSTERAQRRYSSTTVTCSKAATAGAGTMPLWAEVSAASLSPVSWRLVAARELRIVRDIAPRLETGEAHYLRRFRERVTTPNNEGLLPRNFCERGTGLEPVTFSLEKRRSTN